jgi:hypothetical protein
LSFRQENERCSEGDRGKKSDKCEKGCGVHFEGRDIEFVMSSFGVCG